MVNVAPISTVAANVDIKQVPPPHSLIKSNIDASIIPNASEYGLDWLLRDHNGAILSRYYVAIVETVTIKEALS